ncbi:MAG: hypothetical protein KH285_02540 [Anaerotruncus sp.]|nr:hypothetical protein [Anaerotruncus sp.]
MRKSTEDLLEELQNENCKIDEYLKGNGESFVYDKIKDFWEAAIEKSGYSKSNIINKSDFSYCYFYDVINGRKIPGRDKIIRLILTMKLSVDECQEALRISGRSALYPRIRRDSIILFAISNGLSIYQLSELLADAGEEQLK